MNELIDVNITQKNLGDIVDLEVKLEVLLKVIQKIDCKIESYLHLQDPTILDNLYEELGSSIVKLEEVIRIIKANKYALEKSLKKQP